MELKLQKSSRLLEGPPTVEVFDGQRLVKYRVFVDAYARCLIGVGNSMWGFRFADPVKQPAVTSRIGRQNDHSDSLG